MRKVKKGKPIAESTKGSLEYSIYEVDRAFRAQFGYNAWSYCICDTFADHIILRDYELPQDEYWLVTYTQDGDAYTFAAQDTWERVQLAYTPAKNPAPPEAMASMGMMDRAQRTFVESAGPITLVESTSADGVRRVRGIGMTAGTINENMRRYPAPVIADAVARAQQQLGNPAGRIGRGPLMGEAEHPSDRGASRALWLNTVFVWESITLEGNQVMLDGRIVPTAQGQDAITLLEHKVLPGLSLRGLGRSVLLQEAGSYIEEVQELELIGWDATIDPADQTADLILQESAMRRKDLRGVRGLRDKDTETTPATGASPADPPTTAVAASVPASQAIVPIPLADSISADDRRRLDELAVRERVALVSDAIETALADAPYAAPIRQQIADAVRALDLPSADAVPAAVERQRAVADAILSQAQLQLMGRPNPRGPIISGGGDADTFTWPEYAKAAKAIADSAARHGLRVVRSLSAPKSINEHFAAEYLRRYDAAYRHHLIREAREFQDAETSADLNLPYSVLRAIIPEALPLLVATSVFDVQTVDPAPTTNVWYETYSGESGSTATITAGAVTLTALATWYDIGHGRIQPPMVLKDVTDTTTYTEGTDYVIDYGRGRVMGLTGGAISAGAVVHLTYTYDAIRLGEGIGIQRGKQALAYETLPIAADRLAAEITSEAIVFSRAALGYDVVGRTLNRLMFKIAQIIDKNLFYLALAHALRFANNSGGTWTVATDTYDDFAADIGAAKVKIENRFYTANGIIMSMTNADRIANWNAFTQAGARPDADLNATGYVGRLKGLPVFSTVNFLDTYVVVANREAAHHRIGQPMQLKGPFPTYDGSGLLIAADQWYIEEYNGSMESPPSTQGKASYVKIV